MSSQRVSLLHFTRVVETCVSTHVRENVDSSTVGKNMSHVATKRKTLVTTTVATNLDHAVRCEKLPERFFAEIF
jgi:hypothetical protein